jgi:hypothetical protein
MNTLQKLLKETDYDLLVTVTRLYKSGEVSEKTYLDTIATMIEQTHIKTL